MLACGCVIDSHEAKGPAKHRAGPAATRDSPWEPDSSVHDPTAVARQTVVMFCLQHTQLHTTQGPTGRYPLLVLSAGCGNAVGCRQETPTQQTKEHARCWLRLESVRHSAAASGAEASAHQTARVTRTHTHTTGGRHSSPVPPESNCQTTSCCTGTQARHIG